MPRSHQEEHPGYPLSMHAFGLGKPAFGRPLPRARSIDRSIFESGNHVFSAMGWGIATPPAPNRQSSSKPEMSSWMIRTDHTHPRIPVGLLTSTGMAKPGTSGKLHPRFSMVGQLRLSSQPLGWPGMPRGTSIDRKWP